MTCPKCGMTVMWDCECDPELNALIEEGLQREREEKRPEPDQHIGANYKPGHSSDFPF